MALRTKLNQSEYDALDAEAKSLYIEGADDGEWWLDLEPPPETRALKNALTRARQERNALRQRMSELVETFGTSDVEEMRRLMAEAEKKASRTPPMT